MRGGILAGVKTSHLAALVLLAVVPCVALARAPVWVDLTHAFGPDTIYWPTEKEGWKSEIVHRGPTPGGYWYEANKFTTAEHGGTHLDAPAHFAKGKWRVHEIPPERLVGSAFVIDISAKAQANADALLEPADVEAWEKQHGALPEKAIVLVHTGWGKRWPDRKRYLGTDRPGDVANLHFPGVAPAAAEALVARKVKLVGIDTPSIDHGPSKDFRTHRILAEANVPALENVARLELLKPRGAQIYALPMKIQDGSGAPVRIIANVP